VKEYLNEKALDDLLFLLVQLFVSGPLHSIVLKCCKTSMNRHFRQFAVK